VREGTGEWSDRAERSLSTLSQTIKTTRRYPFNALISNFQAIQNLMYIMGDHLEGHQPRTAGDFPKSVKQNCELVISRLEQGSAAIT